ncbi:sulfotransferase family protein [Allomesorhizobium camelthorni]|uniref:Sulfotransferase n=1 Tax=Allomesorhizobium camelthorni TaxID=475069 RepID=A0A6G4WDY1_9HYPH|nr:sulfotransferase [Mesorhizobium camelthorni]NGO52992.1 sulfotransferase [Mesorhizobium camelthorni]
MSRNFNNSPAVCFLLGLPRSGTTLLAHLLQKHPDIAAPPEPWLMLALEAFGRVDHRHPAGPSLIQSATSEFLGRVDRSSVSRAFADAAYSQYLAAAGKRTFIDKTPRYWMVLDYLDSLYPEAPHILLLRNPYAIAASLKSTWGVPFVSERSAPPASMACLADLVLGLPQLDLAYSLADFVLGLPALAAHRARRQTQVVRYELLVARPDEEIRRVIAGLGYDPARIEAATIEQTDYLRSSNFGDRKILEKQGVDKRSVHAWQTELTIEEMQAVTDLVGAELFIELGYEDELRYAQQAGIVDRGRAVTERYRQVFRTWWDLLAAAGPSFDISAAAREPNSTVQEAGQNTSSGSGASTVRRAQHPAGSDMEENLQLANAMVAQLKQALSGSEADRAVRLHAIRDRDDTIETLRGEIVRLEQTLSLREPVESRV